MARGGARIGAGRPKGSGKSGRAHWLCGTPDPATRHGPRPVSRGLRGRLADLTAAYACHRDTARALQARIAELVAKREIVGLWDLYRETRQQVQVMAQLSAQLDRMERAVLEADAAPSAPDEFAEFDTGRCQ